MGTTSPPLKWIKPQLTRLVDEAPAGGNWLHEIKYDGYRMHVRIDGRDIKLPTRTGLDWSHRYPRTIEALGSLKGYWRTASWRSGSPSAGRRIRI